MKLDESSSNIVSIAPVTQLGRRFLSAMLVCSIDSLAFVNLCSRFLTVSIVVDVKSIILFNCCSTDDDVVVDIACVLSKPYVVEVVSFSRVFLGGISCKVC